MNERDLESIPNTDDRRTRVMTDALIDRLASAIADAAVANKERDGMRADLDRMTMLWSTGSYEKNSLRDAAVDLWKTLGSVIDCYDNDPDELASEISKASLMFARHRTLLEDARDVIAAKEAS